MNHMQILAQHRQESAHAFGADEQQAVDLKTLEQLGIGPFAPGGYYETRCKWCGGSEHPKGGYCVALDH
jgi:hypothetical protein